MSATDFFQYVVPALVTLINVTISVFAFRGQRKVTDADAAEKLSNAAAKQAEMDGRRMDDMRSENAQYRRWAAALCEQVLALGHQPVPMPEDKE